MRPQGPTFWHLDAIQGWRDGGDHGTLTDGLEDFPCPPQKDPPVRGLRLPPIAIGSAPLVAQDELPGPASHQTEGTWISEALDSSIQSCEWHRTELTLASLPPGSSVQVSTFTDQLPRPREEIRQLPDELWSEDFKVVGPMQPEGPAGPPSPTLHEALIKSPNGRYLWQRLRLEGDGYGTPMVRSLRIHYPRQTWLEHLPAVFSSNRANRSFLNRFLAICHTEWQKLDHTTTHLRRYFDPAAVPAGAPMDYLASWLGQHFETTWTWEQKRRLLHMLPSYLPRRGTPAALCEILAIYLEVGNANAFPSVLRGGRANGSEPCKRLGFPRLVEGFRERRYVAGTGGREGRLNAHRALWSARNAARLHLGDGAQLDHGRLISDGDPRIDALNRHAHRFRVYVPAAWVPREELARQLRRAIEREKPAHTLGRLCLVEPRLRVGIQATVGLDTVIGAVPQARLADPTQPPPASRAPRQRLGYDTVLACGSHGDPS